MHRVVPAAEALATPRSVVAAASRPANLIAVLITLLGWGALIYWIGNGPRGWQASTCAGLGPVPFSHACAKAFPAKDASRAVPHTAEQAS